MAQKGNQTYLTLVDTESTKSLIGSDSAKNVGNKKRKKYMMRSQTAVKAVQAKKAFEAFAKAHEI